MRLSSLFKSLITGLALVVVIGATTARTPMAEHELRDKAQKEMKDGNYKDALAIFRDLAMNPETDPKLVGRDLDMAVSCYRSLNRVSEIDEFREDVIDVHARNWRLLFRAAHSYFGAQHQGTIIAGKFERGPHRGGGQYVNSMERDRARALQLMQQALRTAVTYTDKADAEFYMSFARFFMGHRGPQGAWRLQYLTDLSELPDYDKGYHYHRRSQTKGAPVDEDGNPVFHHLPETYEAAKTDGERWRWLLEKAATVDPNYRSRAVRRHADFLYQQFGVQTMQTYGWFFAKMDVDAKDTPEIATYALHTLAENETMARLATGIKRFTLPDEFNFVKMYRELGQDRILAQIFENRRQYDKAANFWKTAGKNERVGQILGNWGRFEPVMTHPAGDKAALQFVFRNGTRLHLEAHAIKTRQLLDDLQDYLRSNPRKLDNRRMQIGNIGHRLVREQQDKYVGEKVASWDIELEPRPKHFDRRITIDTPLTKPGAYLLTARMLDGNTSKIVVWINDTVIVRKPMDQEAFFFLADAVTGKPVPGMDLDFFGYRQERTDWNRLTGRRFNTRTRDFTAETDSNGQCVPDADDFDRHYRWLITASDDSGRFAYVGFEHVWYGRRHDREYNETKTFAVTDRPVYRPNQPVKFKFWVRYAKYDLADKSAFGGRKFTVQIFNPKNEKILEKQYKADDYGGFDGEYFLPKEAPLGAYSIRLAGYGGGSFRVEEYKKPEFEVLVDAPDKPVMLGEKIGATIRARYYFGAPVAKATVRYKILRSGYSADWYPAAEWDWFYGSGYWWFASDYDWYPGWRSWGWIRPHFWWWPRSHTPPEVVAEAEARIDKDGMCDVEIDTALAKALHGDTDHRYEITAEVVDESRRTIVGKGVVLVARKPFKVYTWVNRGHYSVGDVVRANFSAQTLAGKPVQGTGILNLYRISYRDGKPIEHSVQKWALDTDVEGRAALQLKASEPGQYRLSYEVTDSENHRIEGGYVFCVRGTGFDGKQFRFNEIELIPEKKEYAAGDKVQLMVNTDRAASTVLLFVRPSNGVYLMPRVLRPAGKSTIEEIVVTKKDMPNFFVEALTISNGRLYTETREIIVPPEKRVLNVEVSASSDTYRPGERAKVKVRLTDFLGEPFTGSTVMSVYDKAVEYISGGSNVPGIKRFFWKWRRRHRPSTRSSLDRPCSNIIPPGKAAMANLGVFGHLVADQFDRENNLYLGGTAHIKSAGVAMRGVMAESAREGSFAMCDASAPAAAPVGDSMEMKVEEEAGAMPPGGTQEVVEPTVRTEFADTAFWIAALETDDNGEAEVEFDMPENLTGWKIRTWAMGHGTKVGEGTAEVVTAKDLMLRMQAPRFFVETDEVVLSANIHNYLENEKAVTAVLEVEGGCLEIVPDPTQRLMLAAGGEERVDWRVKVLKEGEAVIRMKALTDEESDAMEMRFPVYVHGMLKTDSFSGVVRPEEDAAGIEIDVPARRRIDQSLLEIRYSPTLAAAMVDALPYLADYPYGCTEQTLSRFLPAVITQNILKKMGLDLDDIREKRTNLNAQEIGDDVERAKQWKRWSRNPVFEEATLRDMVDTGIRRLTSMQLSDGGWGWFSGWAERSYAHTTAYVVHGLQIAVRNGVAVDDQVLSRGIQWLESYQEKETEKIRNAPLEKKPWKLVADNLDAFVYMVLNDADSRNEEMNGYLYRDRNHLAVYAKAMYAMALHRQKQFVRRDMLIRNIEQYLVEDEENQTAYLRLPNSGYWWYWYGSEYEAHAYYLKLLAIVDPKSEKAAGLVKYLLNNRKHATYWKSTRDTAICIEAMADYLLASGEDKPDMTVEIYLDGIKRKEVEITTDNLFTFDSRFVLSGDALESGKHTVEIRRTGKGPVYFNAYLTNFTLEDFIGKAGLEIKVDRNYYKLIEADRQIKVAGARGQAVDQRVDRYERHPVSNMGELKSGDLVEIELEIESKNDYEYIVFEDMKAAGFEPVELRSGYNANDLGAYMELRDEKVCFFVRALARGKHSVAYRMRAEIPGKFSALPTRAYAMYAPELRANSDEIKVKIVDNGNQ